MRKKVQKPRRGKVHRMRCGAKMRLGHQALGAQEPRRGMTKEEMMMSKDGPTKRPSRLRTPCIIPKKTQKVGLKIKNQTIGMRKSGLKTKKIGLTQIGQVDEDVLVMHRINAPTSWECYGLPASLEML